MPTPPPSERPGPLIKAVEVEGLLGKFSYSIDFASDPPSAHLDAVNEQRLTLLYGKNGSGKTSLLKLLFHGLSSRGRAGHRTAMLQMGFQRLKIELASGSVEFAAEEAVPGGRLVFVVETATGRETTIYPVTTGEEGGIRIGPQDDDPAQALLHTLQINPIFLSDSRNIEGDPLAADETRYGIDMDMRAGTIYASRFEIDAAVREQRNADLRDALDRVRSYLTQLVVTGAQQGSQRVDAVYVNVADTVVRHASRSGRPNKTLLKQLRERIAELADRSEAFREYGLITEFPAKKLAETVERAEARHAWLLAQVLGPYLDGLTERMDALDPGLSATQKYTESVNEFLEGKRIDFRAPGGLSITDDETGESLDPFDLSSGERQILLLLSNIIALRGRTKLFLIDEPELSLNPQWQRRLMPSLLDVSADTELQLLAATHSIEIMSRYRERLRPLT